MAHSFPPHPNYQYTLLHLPSLHYHNWDVHTSTALQGRQNWNWWNDGDSDIPLESHCTVSSFLVKLLNDEWGRIHHGYCQNVLKHYWNISLWLSNMFAEAHSSNSKSHTCHVMWHPLLCFHMSCLPVTLITGHTLTVTITHIISCVLSSWWIFYSKSSI